MASGMAEWLLFGEAWDCKLCGHPKGRSAAWVQAERAGDRRGKRIGPSGDRKEVEARANGIGEIRRGSGLKSLSNCRRGYARREDAPGTASRLTNRCGDTWWRKRTRRSTRWKAATSGNLLPNWGTCFYRS